MKSFVYILLTKDVYLDANKMEIMTKILLDIVSLINLLQIIIKKIHQIELKEITHMRKQNIYVK